MFRFIVPFLILFFSSTGLFSQTIEYTYDPAGNRVLREIVFPRLKTEDSTQYNDMLAGHSVKIFPNPTEGILNVEIENASEGFNATVAIFSSNGMLVGEEKDITTSMSFNINNQPSGIYFLRFQAGEETKTWRIIKK